MTSVTESDCWPIIWLRRSPPRAAAEATLSRLTRHFLRRARSRRRLWHRSRIPDVGCQTRKLPHAQHTQRQGGRRGAVLHAELGVDLLLGLALRELPENGGITDALPWRVRSA